MFTRRSWGMWGRSGGVVAVLAMLMAFLWPGVAGAAPVQQGGFIPIGYGQTVTGAISNAQYEVVYTFQGQAGDAVTITMNRTDNVFDPYLALYNVYPSQNPLVVDDDSGGNLNALIANYRLPTSGTYYIVATRFMRQTGTATGTYTLTLSAGTGLPSGTVSGGAFGGLPIGGSANQGGGQGLAFTCDNVSVPAASLVTFEDVRPGFTYQVTVLGLNGFDPVIGLEAEDGSGLCNDDAPVAVGSQVSVPGVGLVTADALTAQVLFTTSGAIGDIQMRIGGFGGAGGRYVAVFEGLAIAPNTEQDAVTLSVSQAVQNEPIYVYMVSQLASLDPYMQLAGTNFVCDDAGAGSCADTPPFPGGGVSITNGGTYIAGQYDAGIGITPGGTGDFTFIFGSYGGRSAGNYAMIVIGASPGTGGAATTGGPTGPANAIPITYGSTAQNVIDNVNYAWVYSFTGQAGEAVTITMVAPPGSGLDPYLALIDARENILVEDDDSAGNLNSQIIYALPASGTYYIAATRYGVGTGSSTGAFTLSLSRGGTPGGSTGSLDYTLGPTFGSVALTSGFTPAPYTVQITSGGSVDVSAAVGSVCTGSASGYAASAPDFRLQYTAGQYRLRVFFAGSGDTTLVINAPDGHWYCDDDTGGNLQPMLTFDNPMSGQYDIWVGSYSATDFIPGTLTITETNLTPQSAQPSK